jgi:hypothetical protein
MEVQAKLQIGDNNTQIYQKNYNVVNLFCHYTRHTSSSRPDTDACCEHIDITLVAPGMEDLSLYDWYISGQPLSGRVLFDLSEGQGNSNQDAVNLVFDDAYCFAIEEEYFIDKLMRRVIKLSLVANNVTFEGATFSNPYSNN